MIEGERRTDEDKGETGRAELDGDRVLRREFFSLKSEDLVLRGGDLAYCRGTIIILTAYRKLRVEVSIWRTGTVKAEGEGAWWCLSEQHCGDFRCEQEAKGN